MLSFERVVGKDIQEMLVDYDLYLNAYGYSDPLVVALRGKLDELADEDVNMEIAGINFTFDMAVFNNQTEGLF